MDMALRYGLGSVLLFCRTTVLFRLGVLKMHKNCLATVWPPNSFGAFWCENYAQNISKIAGAGQSQWASASVCRDCYHYITCIQSYNVE